MVLGFLLPEMLMYSAACMTLLRYYGIRQVKPFAVICNSISQQDMLVDRCKLYTDNRKYGVRTIFECFRKYIDRTKDDILFIQYNIGSPKEYLIRICDALAEGYWERDTINCMICVVFNGYVPEELTEYFSIIIPSQEIEAFLRSRASGSSISKEIISGKRSFALLGALLENRDYRRFARNVLEEDEELMYAAAMIKAVLYEQPEMMGDLSRLVDEKLKLSAEARDRSDLPELFVDTLYDHTELFVPMTEYQDIRNQKSLESEGRVLYDDQFYYLPITVMETMLKEMSSFAGPTEIKQSLALAGYLDVQWKSRCYYTQKIRLGDKRPYYYLLIRERIDRIGDVSLLVACELKGGNGDEIR